jgi:hypothetical protein
VKQTPAAQVRRRRLATSSSLAVILIIVVVVLTRLATDSSGNDSHPPATTTSSSTATATVSPTPTDTTIPVTRLRQQIAAYLAHRQGAASAAIYDSVSHHLTLVHPALRGRTASIVKVDILETLLHQTGGHLTEEQRDTATSMIENSNNDSATDLWNEDGGASGVASYNSDLGLTQTTPNVDWGLTTTSAADQVTLVRALLQPSSLLTNAARAFQRSLMRHVEADQQWGISGGVPKSAVFGNKNGWLPVSEDHDLWAVNSVGWVHGDGKRYVIAVITQHDATEDYGIDTISHVAALAWDDASVAPAS